MTLWLQPFLQPSLTRTLLIDAVEKYEANPNERQDLFSQKVIVKFKIGFIILIGSGELLTYCINLIAVKIFSLFAEELQDNLEEGVCLFKGILISILISVYALSGTDRASALMLKIEKSADRQFYSLTSHGMSTFEVWLEQTRRAKLLDYTNKNRNPVEVLPSIWDEQVKKLKRAFEQSIRLLEKAYPVQPPDGKYRVLNETRKNILFLRRAANQLAIVDKRT